MVKKQEDLNELEALRARVQQLEQEKENEQAAGDRYLKEVRDLKNKQNKGLNNVTIKPIQDYKAVSLWHISGHNVGKRVGPLHPDAAEPTMAEFANAGIRLSIHKPTEEWIANYKTSKEYKASEEKEAKRRSLKNRSRKESEIEKLTQAIAASQGINPKKLNSIKSENEVL